MTKPNWMTKACGVFLLWAAVPIALSAQTFTTLQNFDGPNGSLPGSGLVQGTDGNFYGTTSYGGAYAYFGTVFKITPSGTLSTLYSFDYNGVDGVSPFAPLVQGANGSLYGTTYEGGSGLDCTLDDYGCGTVFELNLSGALTTLHSFDVTDGAIPYEGLLLASNGDFYGTTYYGGGNSRCYRDYGCGTAFKITPSGTFTTLHIFGGTDGGIGPGGLVQATDGDIYGTTYEGGSSSVCNTQNVTGCGTIFKLTPSGSLTTLHSFDGADGEKPSGLVEVTNGDFFGTATGGGANGDGTFFKITPSGTLTTLYNFCSQTNCVDGGSPDVDLVQGTDGNFYGITLLGGGPSNAGTIFKITPAGTLTTLHDFCSQANCTDGLEASALVQGTDGSYYGTTFQGGTVTDSCESGCGTVFGLSVGLRPFVETQPTSGVAGAAVNILGSNLTGATSVTFNGTAAVFTVVSQYLITTTVPTGATTGKVQVTVPSATLSSNVQFAVRL